MSLNSTPSGERVHIGFFGRRNAGKWGTTTDPVIKSMELLPLGPVVIVDTPGFDDEGALGEKRVRRARRVMNRADLAVLVLDAQTGAAEADRELIALFEEKEIPYIIVINKSDLIDKTGVEEAEKLFPGLIKGQVLYVSALTGDGIHELKERIAALGRESIVERPLIGDLIEPSEIVILVIPIDKAAPKGRLILPQQMMIRGILDADGIPICVKQDRLGELLEKLDCEGAQTKPGLVITDSQVFGEVMARYKGFLDSALAGVRKIDELKDGDVILISEGCTHHRQCGDIGTEKIPAWIRKKTGADIRFETTSGTGFPDDLTKYALIIHCGACMLNDREVRWRMKCAADQGIPAYMRGILDRSTEIVRNE